MRPTKTFTGKLGRNRVSLHVFESEHWRQHPLFRTSLKENGAPIKAICSAIIQVPDGGFALAMVEQADSYFVGDWTKDLPGLTLADIDVTIIHSALDYWAMELFTKVNRGIIEDDPQVVPIASLTERARKEIHFCYMAATGNHWNEIIHCIKRIGEPLEYRFHDRYLSNIDQLNRLVRSFL